MPQFCLPRLVAPGWVVAIEIALELRGIGIGSGNRRAIRVRVTNAEHHATVVTFRSYGAVADRVQTGRRQLEYHFEANRAQQHAE